MPKYSYLIQFYEINICEIMIFRLYTIYNKHEVGKNRQSNQRKFTNIIASARIILRPTVTFWVELGCRNKANCQHVGPRPMGECPAWGSFLRILARIYASFEENHRKLLATSSTSVIED